MRILFLALFLGRYILPLNKFNSNEKDTPSLFQLAWYPLNLMLLALK